MKRMLLLATLAFPCVVQAHGGHACENNESEGLACSHAELLAHLSRADLGATDGEKEDIVNDLWGWTDGGTGREYVIVGMRNGAAFVDVTNPEIPVFLGRLLAPEPAVDSNGFESTCHDDCGEGSGGKGALKQMDVKTLDHYAYIVSERSDFGMAIFDLHKLRDVTSPQIFVADNRVTDFGNAHNLFINEESHFAYVVGNTTEGGADENSPNYGGLLIYDLSEPLEPVFVTDYEDIQYVHDVQCVIYEGPDRDYQGHEICFASNAGIEKDGEGNNVVVDVIDGEDYYLNYSRMVALDVTDKQNIRELSRLVFFEEPVVWWYLYKSYIHQSWLNEEQAFLMVNDEIGNAVDETRTRSYVVETSDLDAISLYATYIHPTMANTHNEYVDGRFTYQANYNAGLRVLDVSAPRSPLQVAYLDTQSSIDQAGFLGGAWTAYPFFDSGTIAISDMRDGLYLARTTLVETGELAPDIAAGGELLLVEGSDDVLYVAYANNGPRAATEVDFTFHLPSDIVFNDVAAPEGLECSAAGRVVTCQAEKIPSCATGLVSLPFDASTMEGEQEVIAMAAAKETEPAGATADNILRMPAGKGRTAVDTGVLESSLLSANCTTPITVNAGSDQVVMSGDEVTLALTVDFPENLLADVAWEQLEGPGVTLNDPTAAQTAFTAPDVNEPVNLVFRAAATNAYGVSGKDMVTIAVEPRPQASDDNDGGGGAWLNLLWLYLLGFRKRR